jgi:hypothetical protein
MVLSNHSSIKSYQVLVALLACLLVGVSCSAPVPKPTGPAADYQDAKDMVKRGQFVRALEFADGQARAVPATPYTERAQVLRAVILAGAVESFKELSDAYAKGADETRNTHFKTEYKRLNHDNLQEGSTAALALAEDARRILEGGKISKELVLETPYPSIEGPLEVADLNTVKMGGWIEPDHQDAAAADSLRKGVDDAMAAAVSGDRSKVRDALASGSAKISGLDFALFLGNQLVAGATFFDRKHGRDPEKLRAVCDVGFQAVRAAEDQLKEAPDKDKDKQVKKLEDQIKTTLKSI